MKTRVPNPNRPHLPEARTRKNLIFFRSRVELRAAADLFPFIAGPNLASITRRGVPYLISVRIVVDWNRSSKAC